MLAIVDIGGPQMFNNVQRCPYGHFVILPRLTTNPMVVRGPTIVNHRALRILRILVQPRIGVLGHICLGPTFLNIKVGLYRFIRLLKLYFDWERKGFDMISSETTYKVMIRSSWNTVYYTFSIQYSLR